MIRRLVIRTLVTMLALWVAGYFLVGFSVAGGFVGFLTAGLVLALLNGLVRPVIKLVTLPLILLTLGLFTVVINAAMLWIAAALTGLIVIAGPLTLLWATLIISAVHMVLDRMAD
jgi:putative membrane protein